MVFLEHFVALICLSSNDIKFCWWCDVRQLSLDVVQHIDSTECVFLVEVMSHAFDLGWIAIVRHTSEVFSSLLFAVGTGFWASIDILGGGMTVRVDNWEWDQ